MARWIVCLASLFVVSTTYADQQEIPKWGLLLPALSITSDYRFNGMSLSNREPVFQGSLHLWRPDGYYAGFWMSEVDFLDGETTLELDSYVGRDFKHGQFETKIELMYSAFNDDSVSGPTYDFFQVKTALRRNFKDSAIGVAFLWSPSGSAGAGTVTQLRAEGEHRFTEFIKTSAVVGRRLAEVGFDRTYWDFGFTFEWGKFDLDIRYYDTNLDKEECFYTDWCEAGVAAKLTLASY